MTKGSARARSATRLLLCVVAIAAMSGCNNDGSSSSAGSSSGLGIAGTPATQAAIGQVYSFTPTVTGSAESSTVGFSIQNKPLWATFNTSTGRLEGTPGSADLGNFPNIVISASTGSVNASLGGFTITVLKPGTTGTTGTPQTLKAVTLNWEAPTTNTDGTPLNDIAGYTIRYGTGAAHLFKSVNVGRPTTSYTLQNLTSGVWFFAVSAYTTGGAQGNPSEVVSTTVD